MVVILIEIGLWPGAADLEFWVFFEFFWVFGPFSRFFEVGDGPGVSRNPFSCPEIDFSS